MVLTMGIPEPVIKLMTKKDFEDSRSKFKEIAPEVDLALQNAKETQVLAFEMHEGSEYTVTNAKILTEDVFVDILKNGTFGSE